MDDFQSNLGLKIKAYISSSSADQVKSTDFHIISIPLSWSFEEDDDQPVFCLSFQSYSWTDSRR